jgi:hypothetical protein
VLPSDWTTRLETASDEDTGAKTTKWYAIEPGAKHDVRIYVSGDAALAFTSPRGTNRGQPPHERLHPHFHHRFFQRHGPASPATGTPAWMTDHHSIPEVPCRMDASVWITRWAA